MQSVTSRTAELTAVPRAVVATVAAESAYAGYQIIRRWVLDQPRVAQSPGTPTGTR